jgi:predicted Zn-ribbon and HTH transcriptional regulator
MKKEEESATPNAKRLAMLVTYLCRQIALLPRHKLLVLRQAARRNFDMGNFGVALPLLEQLAKSRVPDIDKINEKIQQCKDNSLKDADPFPPSFKICYKTMKVLTGSHIRCKSCESAFADDAVTVTSFCPACLQKGVLAQAANAE